MPPIAAELYSQTAILAKKINLGGGYGNKHNVFVKATEHTF